MTRGPGLAIVVLVVTSALLAACAKQAPAGDDTGYYLRFPESISAANDQNGGATIDIETNLPQDTFATVSHEEVGAQTSGYDCCPVVRDAILRITVSNHSCYGAVGSTPSTGFHLTVTVVPDSAPLQFECLDPDGCSNPQPQTVQAVLGPEFEHLNGDQVTTVQGMRALVADATYDWPPGVCDAHFASDGFMPETCEEGYGDISADSTQAAANNLIGIFQQLRLCELYDDATAEFRSTHRWSEFLEQTKGLDRRPRAARCSRRFIPPSRRGRRGELGDFRRPREAAAGALRGRLLLRGSKGCPSGVRGDRSSSAQHRSEVAVQQAGSVRIVSPNVSSHVVE
jgi:hypothetical protein